MFGLMFGLRRRLLLQTFSTFPDKWQGVGLLLLRVAAGAVLITLGADQFGDKRELGFFILVLASAMIVAGVLLVIGFATRFVAVVGVMVSVSSVFSWLPASNVGPLETPMTAALSAVIAVAVACLGAGAYSLDARLFGRREIIIPASSSNT